MIQLRAFIQALLNIRPECNCGIQAARRRALLSKQLLIDAREQPRVLIRLTPHHHAIHMGKLRLALRQRFNSTVNANMQFRAALL